MGTPLGTGAGNKIIFNVRNNAAVSGDTIPEGGVASLVVSAVSAHDYLTQDPVFNVVLNATADSARGTGGVCFGVALGDIAPQEYGQVCVFGLCKGMGADTDLTAGKVVSIKNSSTNYHKFSLGVDTDDQAPYGIWLGGTSADGELDWACVDFISGAYGGDSGGAAVSDMFWGKAY